MGVRRWLHLGRFISLALVFLLGLPAVAPALELSGGPETRLALCCRRGGSHACAMLAGDGSGHKIGAVCNKFGTQQGVAAQGAMRIAPAETVPGSVAVTAFLGGIAQVRVKGARRWVLPLRGPPGRMA